MACHWRTARVNGGTIRELFMARPKGASAEANIWALLSESKGLGLNSCGEPAEPAAELWGSGLEKTDAQLVFLTRTRNNRGGRFDAA